MRGAKSVLMIGNLPEKPENLKTVSHHPLMTRLMQSRYGITWCRPEGLVSSQVHVLFRLETIIRPRQRKGKKKQKTLCSNRHNSALRAPLFELTKNWWDPRVPFKDKDNVTNVLIYENIIENKSFAESQQALSHKSQSWEFSVIHSWSEKTKKWRKRLISKRKVIAY